MINVFWYETNTEEIAGICSTIEEAALYSGNGCYGKARMPEEDYKKYTENPGDYLLELKNGVITIQS